MAIKTVKKTLPAKAAKEIEQNIYVCDLCGYENQHRKSFIECECGRLVCRNVIIPDKKKRTKCSAYDEHDWGDYPDQFCIICWKLKFEKYWSERESIEEECSNKLEALDKKIFKESLESEKDDEYCPCGNTKADHSEFCKDCI